MFVKLQNNTIKYAPKNLIEEDITIFNFNTDENLMKEYGYKLLVQVERPTNSRRYNITYQENTDSIQEILTYTETEEEYNERIEQEQKDRRNQEIDMKIKELNEMSVPEILNNNVENLKIYRDVIAGLEAARPL